MSLLINVKDSLQEYLEQKYKRSLFTIDELKKEAKIRGCIIVTDILEGVPSDATYEIKAYYEAVDFLCPMIELKNYKDENKICTRPDDQGVLCVTENGERDFYMKNINLLLIKMKCACKK